jgi:hypothetical protein
VKLIKGMLRLRPGMTFLLAFTCLIRFRSGSSLTDSEDTLVRNTVVVVETAGVPEVNGEYFFVDIKNNAGFYARTAVYREKEVRFTLYKCSLRNGGFQWFISITPDNNEPGTTNDIDFYYAIAKTHDYLPPSQWSKLTVAHTRDPCPKLRLVRKPVAEDTEEDVEGPSVVESENKEQQLDESGVFNMNSFNSSFNSIENGNDSDSDKESLMMVADETGLNDESFASHFSDRE